MIDGTNGQYADFTPPSGYIVQDVKRLTTNLGSSSSAIPNRPSIISFDAVSGSIRAASPYVTTTLTFFGIMEISQ